MKIKGRKVFAFITTWLTLSGAGVLTIVFASDSWAEFSKWFVIGILVNAFVFVSFVIVKDIIKSKLFNEDLFKGLKDE